MLYYHIYIYIYSIINTAVYVYNILYNIPCEIQQYISTYIDNALISQSNIIFSFLQVCVDKHLKLLLHHILYITCQLTSKPVLSVL